jgi:hypothetical protein
MALAAVAVPALAQRYEFGMQGGTTIYFSQQISNSRGSVDAGFSPGWTAGFTLGNNMYEHVGGEIRYSYLNNGMKLTGGSATAKFAGEAHAIHYDLLLQGRSSSRVRPYFAFGAGAKIYRGTGAEQAFQPLSDIAILTKTQGVQPLISVGGGLKVRISDNMLFRFDVHDYLTPFPTKVITPVAASSSAGWLNNIVPTAGLTFTF